MNYPQVIAGHPQVSSGAAVRLPVWLCLSLLNRARHLHAAGLTGFGLLISDPAAAGYPFEASDAVFFDPQRNHRNDPAYQPAFHAQGDYFRQFDDAGFVADPAELLAVWRAVEESGREIVAPFHVHRRQPANFSVIDYRLHNPAFPWHLIVSLRDPARPGLRAFRVSKDPAEFGISERDARQHSESDYPGPEVTPLPVVVQGGDFEIRRLMAALSPDRHGRRYLRGRLGGWSDLVPRHTAPVPGRRILHGTPEPASRPRAAVVGHR
jgi:proteasome lid subunit RPN8/RPN11